MKVTREQSLTQPFVIEANDLEKFCERLHRVTSKITFETLSNDKLTREFTSLDEFLKFENSPKKELQRLRIKAHSADFENNLVVRFDKDFRFNITIVITGEEESVLKVSDYIDEYLMGIRPWYQFIARTNYILFMTLIWMTLWTGVLITITVIKPSVYGEIFSQPFSLAIRPILFGLVLGMIPNILGLVLNIIRNAVFPMGVFATGQGAKRHKDKEIIRTGVIVAFIVSFVSSILASLVFALKG